MEMHRRPSAWVAVRELSEYPNLYFKILIFASVVLFAHSMSRPFLPILATQLDPVGLLAGLSISSYFFARVFVELPAGIIVDKFGGRMPILIGLSQSIIGAFLCASSTTIYMFISGLTVWGLGTALFFTCSNFFVVRLFEPSMRGRALGLFQAFEFVGIFAGAPLGGFLAERLGYNFVFYVAGLLVVAVFLLAICTRDLKTLQINVSIKPKTPVRQIVKRLGNTTIFKIGLASMSRMLVSQGIISTILPIYLFISLDLNTGPIGIMLGIRTIGLSLGTLGSDLLVGRFGQKQGVLVGLATESLCLYLYGLTANLEYLLILALIEGASAGIISVLLVILMTENTERESIGSVIGLYRTFMDIGGVIGPVLIMSIYGVAGVNASFTFAAILLAINIFSLSTIKIASTGRAALSEKNDNGYKQCK